MIGLRMKNSKVKSSRAITSILLCCLCFSFSIIDAQTANYFGSQCSNTTFSADNSGITFKANIQSVFSLLSIGADRGLKFQNATAGNDTTNMVYGQYDCRGDAKTNFCEFCVHTGGNDVVQRCPNSVSAIVWYDACILRYSNQKFSGHVTTSPWWNRVDNRSISDPQEPTKAQNFMHILITSATGTPLLYSKSEFNYSNTEQRYGFVQCSRDLSAIGCSQCLKSLLSHVPTCCATNHGWMVVAPSCFIRYADTLFYEVDDSTALVPIPNKGHEHGSSKSRIVAISIASGVAVVLLSFCIIYYLQRRHKKTKGGVLKDTVNYSLKEDSLDADLPLIPFSVVESSTDHFSEASKLGEGGFGPVYKGILPDGRHAAVKRLSITSSQGVDEFKNEVVLIAKLQHRNLVRLLGCCVEGGEKLLIYEYMPNSSLDFHLFGKGRGTALDWKERLYIINGIAKGLLYLHEDSRLRVIHRDLKASNILLDDQLNPKISDFGLARTFGGDQEGSNTSRVMGTYGYMPPEYAMEGLFSIKSDVFSFGVLLLEIISGRKNSGFHYEHGINLLEHAWKLWGEEKSMQLMDPIIETTSEQSHVKKCIHIGLLCVQEDAADRPTMSTVVFWLASDLPALPKPTKPPFSVGRQVKGEGSTSSSLKFPSINVVTISYVEPR